MITQEEIRQRIDLIQTQIEETKETIKAVWKHRNQHVTVPIIRYLNLATVRSSRRRLDELQRDLEYYQRLAHS